MGRQKKTSAKAYEVRISTNAIQNIDEISGYFAVVNQQPLNAVKVGDFLYKVIDRIARNPFAFRECQEIAHQGQNVSPCPLLFVAHYLPDQR